MPERIKYLGINRTKEVKGLYSKNYKTLIEKNEDDTNKQKDSPCSWWIGRNNIVEMSIPSKAIYRFTVIPIKIPKAFSRTRTNCPKICMEQERPQIAREILRKKNRIGGITIPDFKIYCKAVVIKTEQYGMAQKIDTQIHEREYSPEINTQLYAQLIFDKGGKNMQWEKESLINKWC